MLKPFENADVARDALLQGQVDYAFDDGISLIFWLHGTASSTAARSRAGLILEPQYFGEGMAIAVPKKDQQIKTLINGALARCARAGAWTRSSTAISPVKVY